jgi:hypothetical protein
MTTNHLKTAAELTVEIPCILSSLKSRIMDNVKHNIVTRLLRNSCFHDLSYNSFLSSYKYTTCRIPVKHFIWPSSLINSSKLAVFFRLNDGQSCTRNTWCPHQDSLIFCSIFQHHLCRLMPVYSQLLLINVF